MIDLAERKQTDFVTPKNHNKKVVLSGFIEKIRLIGKNLVFLVLKDIKGSVQITFKKENFNEKDLKEISSIPIQSVISLEGIVKKSKLCKKGVEVIAKKYEILSKSAPNLPIDFNSETGLDKRLDNRWIDLRTEKNTLIFQILSDFINFSREYLLKNEFIEIFTPKIIGAASEGGAEVFELPYFDKKAYLAQSPQFFKQMALSAGFEKVFEVAPVFRADPSSTSRHVTEFTSFDLEMAYITSFEDVMKVEENMIAYSIKKIKEKWGGKVKEVFDIDLIIPRIPFPRLKMEEVYKILQKNGSKIKKGEDISTTDERIIGEYVKKKFNHDFVFITDYPWKVRSFYHMRDSKNNSLSFDLLYKGVEITTGAQREHRYEKLVSQAKEKGLNLKLLDFYFNFFKYGCPPHGGFGLGPARFVKQMLDLSNIREAIFLPRDMKRLMP